MLKGNAMLAATLEERLGRLAGIREASVNTRTGSLLILYDEGKLAEPANGLALIGALSGYLPITVTASTVSFSEEGRLEDATLLGASLRAILDRDLGVERVLVDSAGQVCVSYDPDRLNMALIIEALLRLAGAWSRIRHRSQNESPEGRKSRHGRQSTEEMLNG